MRMREVQDRDGCGHMKIRGVASGRCSDQKMYLLQTSAMTQIFFTAVLFLSMSFQLSLGQSRMYDWTLLILVVRFFGDHTSNLSVFGCKYRYLPDKPHLRRLIRGSVCGKLVFVSGKKILNL